MTNELAKEVEDFLLEKLSPDHGFILIIGETGTSHSGIISNYDGSTVVEILHSFAKISKPQNIQNN